MIIVPMTAFPIVVNPDYRFQNSKMKFETTTIKSYLEVKFKANIELTYFYRGTCRKQGNKGKA